MADLEKFTYSKSIKFKILVLLLVPAAVAVLAIAGIAVFTTQSEGRSAQEISSQALRSQAENDLAQLTTGIARENDLILVSVLNDVKKLAAYAAAVFDNPEAFSDDAFWRFEDHMKPGDEGQFANSEEDITSVFVANFQEVNPAVMKDIQLGGYLEMIVPALYENDPNTVAIYFATPNEVTRYYPNVNLGAVLPPDFKVTGRVWFEGSTLVNNPERKPWWSPVYVDATGWGLVSTAATPVYNHKNELLGVVGFDVTLEHIRSNIEATRFLQSGYSFLIDQSGRAIALPVEGYQDILGRPPEAGEFGTDLNNSSAAFSPLIQKMIAGESGFENLLVEDRELFVAFAPLPSAGWSLASVVEAQDVLQVVSALQQEMEKTTQALIFERILPVSGVIFAFLVFTGLFLTNRLVYPVQKLAAAAQKIGAGVWDFEIPRTEDDEIGVLAKAFGSMAQQLHASLTELEERVAERTHDLERRTRQLQAAAEVARDSTSIRKVDVLLNRAVNLIRDRFGFYHAGLFLSDERGEFAVLRAATGEAGAAMLAQDHKLAIGKTGLVGYVASTGRPRIALDVGADAVHFRNPHLPETRSELALPLKVGEKVIGVLDVQSKQPSAFTDDDVMVLQTMADQLAVSIDSARLFQEVQDNLQELESVYGRYSQEAWRRLMQGRDIVGYQYKRTGITPLLREEVVRNGEKGNEATSQSVHVPVRVRGEVIATLEVWPEERQWGAANISFLEGVGERLGQAMESARLFEETRAGVAREQTLNQLVSRLSHSLDLDALLRNAVRSMGHLPNVTEAAIHIGPPENLPPGNGRDDID